MFTKKQLWALLIPLMIEQILNSLMGTADTMMVSNVGSAAISAVSLVDSINTLILNIFSALATGGAIVCSQYIGKQRIDRANAAGRQLVLSMFAISTVISAGGGGVHARLLCASYSADRSFHLSLERLTPM